MSIEIDIKAAVAEASQIAAGLVERCAVLAGENALLRTRLIEAQKHIAELEKPGS